MAQSVFIPKGFSAVALDWQPNVINIQSAPPGAPNAGDRYIVLPAGTGLWAGQDNDIATFNGVVWMFTTPENGWVTYVEMMSTLFVFNGASWGELPFFPGNFQTTGVLFDGTNPTRFTVTALAGVFQTPTGATLTIPSGNATGAYRISVDFEWGYGNITSNFLHQVTLNGTAIVEGAMEPIDTDGTGGVIDGSDIVNGVHRSRTITHTNGVASVLVFQVAREDGTEDAAVRRVELAVEQVA